MCSLYFPPGLPTPGQARGQDRVDPDLGEGQQLLLLRGQGHGAAGMGLGNSA